MALAGSQSQACLSNTYRTSSDSCSSSSDSESARRRRNVFPVIRIAEPDPWSCVTRRVVQGTSLFRRAKVSSERRLHSDPPPPCQATPQARTAPPQQGRHPLRTPKSKSRYSLGRGHTLDHAPASDHAHRRQDCLRTTWSRPSSTATPPTPGMLGHSPLARPRLRRARYRPLVGRDL